MSEKLDGDTKDFGGLTIGIDYESTAKMRLSLAMTNIQKYSALSDFDDGASSLRASWAAYYKKIIQFVAEEKYEEVFSVTLPDHA